MKFYHRIDSQFRKDLKDLGTSYYEIAKGCLLMDETLKQLKVYAKNYPIILQNIEENIEHFDFCNDFAKKIIPQSEWDDYSFDGDLLGLFNSYLSEFWDICDTLIGDDMKFCWVEL